MMEWPGWAPTTIDLDRPSPARVYDCLLGGSHNFAADRAAAAQLLAIEPDAARFALANRAFLHRAVRELVAAGVRQFLDVGSGIPTRGSVHEIAQRENPNANVVYVDHDAVAVAHSQSLLGGNDRAGAVRADLRQPDTILDDPVTRRLIDFDQPVAVLLVSMLHFVPDRDDPVGIVSGLTAPASSGSYLAISHLSWPRDAAQAQAQGQYSQQVHSLAARSSADVQSLFVDFELIEPGLVSPCEWRARAEECDEDLARRIPGLAGVGQKPGPGSARPGSASSAVGGRV